MNDFIRIKDEWKKNALVDHKKYEELYKYSIENNENFWNEHGKRLDWIKPYTKIKNVKYSSKEVIVYIFHISHFCLILRSLL